MTEGISTEDIENAIRDNLSGTPRKTTMNALYNVVKKQLIGISKPKFNKVWNSLINDGYLIKRKDGSYEWS